MSPHEQLIHRHARLQQRLTLLGAVSDRYSWIRLVVVVVGAIAVFPIAALVSLWAIFPWMLIVFVVFLVILAIHTRIQDTIRQFEIWRDTLALNMARLQLDWETLPADLVAPNPNHPFENDFDVSGPYSLHRLIDTTTTREASLRLHQWLLTTTPQVDEIMKRQAIVREMRGLRLFREKLILKATPTPKALSKKRTISDIEHWLDAPHSIQSLERLLVVSIGIILINIFLFTMNQLAGWPAFWQIGFLIYLGINAIHPDIRELFHNALRVRTLILHAYDVLSFLEKQPFHNEPALQVLTRPLHQADSSPTHLLKKFNRILGAAGLQQNSIVWLMVNAVMPWDILVALQLNRARQQLRASLPQWLDIWTEMEALSALANFAYLNPDTTFPEFHSGGAVFEAIELGHPLIAQSHRVTNSFTIDSVGDVALLTGSNMAGKSTFLRSIGLNLVLAYAGGTVVAQNLRSQPLRLFACIRVTDSVTDGISYFYAEVKRLKALADALDKETDIPLLYLIDEIFKGTNNRERLIGSRAYIRSLIGKSGVGLIATHDLELVQLGDEFEQITNYHFRDDVRDNRMVFDYTLREGPCPTTNALKIMALEGLPISDNT